MKSAFSAGQAQLHDALTRLCEDGIGNINPLDDYDGEEIEALSPRRDEEHTDRGSFLAWRASRRYLPRGA